MRIEAGLANPCPTSTWLTRDEAGELRDTLEPLMQEGDSSWHGHVSSTDYQPKITVALDRV